jgi:hypothetical protein
MVRISLIFVRPLRYKCALEALTMVQMLVAQSPDIQKVLAFEGAFEKLFSIVQKEGGIDGGVVPQGALTCVDGLLRFNPSNQVHLVLFDCQSVALTYSFCQELLQRNPASCCIVLASSLPFYTPTP